MCQPRIEVLWTWERESLGPKPKTLEKSPGPFWCQGPRRAILRRFLRRFFEIFGDILDIFMRLIETFWPETTSSLEE